MGQRPGHSLRHIVPSCPAGRRHRDDTVILQRKTLCRLRLRHRPPHAHLCAKQQLRHPHAHFLRCPRCGSIFSVQYPAAHASLVSKRRCCTGQPSQVMLSLVQPGTCAAQRLPLRGAVSTLRHTAQHPVAKGAPPGVQQLPQASHGPPRQCVTVLDQSFLTAMMTRTFLPAAAPKLSYQPVRV